MQTDQSLDQREMTLLESNQDPRFPSSDWVVYQAYAQRWAHVVAQIRGTCDWPSAPPEPQDTRTTEQWFSEAITNHTQDAQTSPGNAVWDRHWVADYQKLLGMFQELSQ
jgi:hypothetical protein